MAYMMQLAADIIESSKRFAITGLDFSWIAFPISTTDMTICVSINLLSLSSSSMVICKFTCGLHRIAAACIIIRIHSPPGLEMGHHIHIWERSSFRAALCTLLFSLILFYFPGLLAAISRFSKSGKVGMASVLHWNRLCRKHTPLETGSQIFPLLPILCFPCIIPNHVKPGMQEGICQMSKAMICLGIHSDMVWSALTVFRFFLFLCSSLCFL